MPSDHFLRPLVSASTAAAPALLVDGRETPLATTLELAGDSAARRRGLLGRTELALDAAVIIAPCSAVHTFGMKFAIDVIFAARDGRVVNMARAVGPRRVATAWGAFAAIEMAAGEASRHGLNAGDRLRITASWPAPPQPERAPR